MREQCRSTASEVREPREEVLRQPCDRCEESTKVQFVGRDQEIPRAVELPVIQAGFASVDDFVARAQSILQRRKARSGRSLELHTRQIFIEERLQESVHFSHQPESESRTGGNTLQCPRICLRGNPVDRVLALHFGQFVVKILAHLRSDAVPVERRIAQQEIPVLQLGGPRTAVRVDPTELEL